MNEKLNPVDTCSAVVRRGGHSQETAHAWGNFEVVCTGPDGQVRWIEFVKNQVVNEGKNYILDNSLAGSAFTTTGPKMSLVTNTGFSAYTSTDTYGTHTGWADSTAYTARQAVTWAAASGGTKAANSVSFSITASDTVRGCAMYFTVNTTPANTAAASSILLSAGDFTGGNKSVGSGDTIQVSYTFGI